MSEVLWWAFYAWCAALMAYNIFDGRYWSALVIGLSYVGGHLFAMLAARMRQ